jgi:hypothetical protein
MITTVRDGSQHCHDHHHPPGRSRPLTVIEFLMGWAVTDHGRLGGLHFLRDMPEEAFDHFEPDGHGRITLSARIPCRMKPHARLRLVKHRKGYHARVVHLGGFSGCIDAHAWPEFWPRFVRLVERVDEYLARMGRGPSGGWAADGELPEEVAG